MIGSRLGPYELLEELGRGGMATVHRAYQPSMDRYVAVKVILRQLADDAASVERFQREARLIARLEHPHILPVYDFDGNHSPQYIVMRYLAGGTLREALAHREDWLTPEVVLSILVQVASALDYAHRQGIIHRDLKPSNIMVDDEGNAFLTDFGIARLLAEADATLTDKGVMIGTPDYMAPEQALADLDVGPPADIYALGVVVFELLTGRLPFTGPTPMARAFKHLDAIPPRATELCPELPAALDEVCLRALAKRPEERFPTAGALAQAVGLALGLEGAVPASPLPTPAPPARRSRRPADSEADSRSTLSEQNKLVTVLCVNAAEYIEMVDDTDGAEAVLLAESSLWRRVRTVVTSRKGQILTQTHTSVLAVWGAETAREDDAESAVRAALAIREGFAEDVPERSEGEPLPVRIGVHTGLTLLTPTSARSSDSGPITASGATVSIATRLAERAEDTILIGHDTFREVRGIFDLVPAEPIRILARAGAGSPGVLPTYRVLAAKSRSFGFRARGIEGVDTALVGRRAEIEQLQRAFDSACEDREAQVITIVGGAGLGKSRLLDEFETWADLRPERFFLFRGRATPSTGLAPFALVRDLLSYRFAIMDNESPTAVRGKLERGVAALLREQAPDEEMAHLIGHLAGFDLGDSPHTRGLRGDPEQLAARARKLFARFFERVARVQPVLMTLEDIHNADDASLDLLAELVGAARDLPLVVVFLARPSLAQRRPDWGSGVTSHRRITLEPLDRRDSRQLVREILQKVAEVPTALRDLLVDRAEGNPLFMEELVKMLIEDRVIVKDSEETWHIEATRLDHLRVPPTLAGLLQARLDTLLHPERLTLQRAAVIGRVFADTAVQALDAADDQMGHVSDLESVLAGMVERGFLHRREISSFEGSTEYMFAQNMMRDLIYQSILRRQRTSYHVVLADWLARSRRAEEHLPLIAEQYEKAGHNDAAAEYLAKAGDRAMSVCAFSEARSFFLRALELSTDAVPEAVTTPPSRTTPPQPPVERSSRPKAVLHLSLGEVLRLLGSYTEAETQLELALGLAEDPRTKAAALYQLSQVASALGDYPKAQRMLDDSLPQARAAAEPATLAQVLYGLGDLLWRNEDYDEAIPTLEASLEQARLANDPSAVLYALNRLGSVRLFQKHSAEARALFEEGRQLAMETGNRDRLVAFLNNLGEVERLQGNSAEARDLYRETLLINREIGRPDVESVLLSNLAAVSLQLGELDEAERYAREGLELARDIGLTRMMVGSLILFAQLAARSGNTDRALALLGLVHAHPATDADLRRYAAPTLEELGDVLPPATIEASLARGRELSFDATVDQLLATP